MRSLLLFTLSILIACSSSGADPGELRVANKRVATLERMVNKLEADRLRDACQVADLLMRENAMQRVDLAGKMAAVKQLEQLLHVVSQSRSIKKAHHSTASDIAARLIANVKGGGAPAFLFVVDVRGRVVTRVGLDTGRYGDTLRASPAIQEALHGFMRDDMWIVGDKLYRVAIAPVVQRELKEGYGGAIVVGYAVDKTLASALAKRLRVNIGFYSATASFVQTARVPAVANAIRSGLAKLGSKRSDHCLTKPVVIAVAADNYLVLSARLPGHAGTSGAGYAVFVRRSIRPGKD